jgi:hypothetical protein
MMRSIRVYTKTQRADAPGKMIGVRLQPASVAALDTWISGQEDAPTRPEAIRRLVERALAG